MGQFFSAEFSTRVSNFSKIEYNRNNYILGGKTWIGLPCSFPAGMKGLR